MMKSRRRLLMAQGLKVDVSAFLFSYTGTWTDSVMEINGQPYRVLQLKSNGTLTFDERMVKNKIKFDVWGIGKGSSGDHYNHTFGTGSSSTSTVTYTCPNCGTQHSVTRIDYYGYDGTASGWKISTGLVTNDLTAVATMTNVHSASLGNIFSFSGTSRSGNAWFSAGSYGAGGSAGWSFSVDGYTCSCGNSYAAYSQTMTNPTAGNDGIIVIRIPLEV